MRRVTGVQGAGGAKGKDLLPSLMAIIRGWLPLMVKFWITKQSFTEMGATHGATVLQLVSGKSLKSVVAFCGFLLS